MAQAGAREGLRAFSQVANYKQLLRKPIQDVPTGETYPAVVSRMIQAVAALAEKDFTPMAAVAGSIADQVADYLIEHGADKAVIDNGGDIAIRLKPGQVAVVGVRTSRACSPVTYTLRVEPNEGIGGVATSGLGGRSLTKGIASAAVTVAASAALADAAATLIANSASVDDPAIRRDRAEKVDPTTDIPGQLVTVSVGHLPENKVKAALNQALSKARMLEAQGIIKAALIARGTLVMVTSPGLFSPCPVD